VVVQEILQELVSIAQKQHPHITLTMTDATVTLNARVGALKRCIQNVLSNACRYGTTVIVSLTQQDGAIFITIEDDGAGIPEEQFEAVFRPFYRLEQSRNLDTGGIGLGLSIARDIARSHGGDITLGRSRLGGLKVVVQLHC
jgi:two-component system osmolarity sensor histidine kinase EnvZ